MDIVESEDQRRSMGLVSFVYYHTCLRNATCA